MRIPSLAPFLHNLLSLFAKVKQLLLVSTKIRHTHSSQRDYVLVHNRRVVSLDFETHIAEGHLPRIKTKSKSHIKFLRAVLFSCEAYLSPSGFL